LRYQVKQKVFSFGDSYTIKDEYGEDRYVVRGEIFSFGHKLTVEDMSGIQVAYIEQKLLKFMPEYSIFLRGQLAAKVKKEFTFFTPKFYIDSNMGNYTIEGEIFSHEFSILKGGNSVSTISKEWFSFSDSYGVDIADSENQPFLLALVIVIDEVLYDHRDK
jgi:uncharacterized protein YxjI